jgi:hypothetical protein
VTSTLDFDTTTAMIDQLLDLATEHFEILKAHHPEGPHECVICSQEVPGMMARLQQVLASIETWRRTNS